MITTRTQFLQYQAAMVSGFGVLKAANDLRTCSSIVGQGTTEAKGLALIMLSNAVRICATLPDADIKSSPRLCPEQNLTWLDDIPPDEIKFLTEIVAWKIETDERANAESPLFF